MIFPEKKVIFVHIPKTGGTTVTFSMASQIYNSHYINECKENKSKFLTWIYNKHNVSDRKIRKAHLSAIEYKENVKDFDKYWKFTIIRNPFDQISSLFNQLKMMNVEINKRFLPYKKMNFEEYVLNDGKFSIKGDDQLIDQKKMITHDDKIIVDNIYLYDDYNSCVKSIKSKCDLTVNVDLKLRETKTKNLYNPEMVNKVLDLYGDTYELYRKVKNDIS